MRFTIIDKRTREEIWVLYSDMQEKALKIAQDLYPEIRVDAIYDRPPMAMTDALTKRAARMSKR